jgi:PAS domain S-box-containing protein
LRKDGSRVPVLIGAASFEEGVDEGIAFVLDLTERKRAEEALGESRARLASVIDSAMDAIITIDANQRIILFNSSAERMFGYPAADAVGHPLDRFIPERFRQAHREHVLAFGQTQVTRRRMGALRTVYGLRANGEEFPIEASISQIESGGQKLYTVILRDITERKQAEEELRQAQASQFEISLETRVRERTRIARELHDTILQNFQGLLLRFQSALKMLPDRPQEAKRRLESALDQAAEAITDARDAIQGLRSLIAETADLARALTALGEQLTAQSTDLYPPAIEVEVEGAPRPLDPVVRDEAYHIAGEALRNAFRHAQARRITVEILYDQRQFRLRVRDDGKGIDEETARRAAAAGHFGLHGMRERAEIVGGQLEIRSRIDSGTEVELSIPGSIAYGESARRFWVSRILLGNSRDHEGSEP